MLNRIKKSLIYIVTGSTTVILTACYGVMVNCKNFYDKKIVVKDKSGKPIRGLQLFVSGDLKYYGNERLITDEKGV